MKCRRALTLVKTIQSKVSARIARRVERRRVGGGQDADRRQRDRLGALLLERVGELAGLLARAGHDDAPAEERPRVEPAQVLAQPDHRADDEQRRPIVAARAPAMSPSVPSTVSCCGVRGVVDERRRFVGGPAVREQRADDGADLPGAGVADERAAGPARCVQSTPRRLVGLRLVPAEQHDHVARLGIGERHAGVGGPRDRQRACPARPRTGSPARAGTALPCRRCRRRTDRPTSAARRPCLRAPFRRAGSRSLPGRAAWARRRRRRSARRRPRAQRSSRGVDPVVVERRRRRAPRQSRPRTVMQRRIAGAGADDVDDRAASCMASSQLGCPRSRSVLTTAFARISSAPSRDELVAGDAHRRAPAGVERPPAASARGSTRPPSERADDRLQLHARRRATLASAPSGIWQPPPSAATSARSASSAAAAAASCIGLQRAARRARRRRESRSRRCPGPAPARTPSTGIATEMRDAEAEPAQAGRGEHQRVVVAAVELAQPRVDIAADRREARAAETAAAAARCAGRCRCRFAASRRARRARSSTSTAARPLPAARPRRADLRAAATARDRQPVRQHRRHVLAAVHREVDRRRASSASSISFTNSRLPPTSDSGAVLQAIAGRS